jgi:RNA polymerase sigma-70 factor (ECF subfamily)
MDAVMTSALHETDQRWTALMAAAQAGDDDAYNALLYECIPFIRRVARRQGVRPDDIGDVVQETLLTVHRARWTYDPDRSFAAWLRTIAQRRAIDGMRRAGRASTHETYAPLAYENHSDMSDIPGQAAAERERISQLGVAIGTLPSRQRDAIDHLVLRGHSLAHAAKLTGRSPGSLRVNWHRAVKALRTQLNNKD